MLLPEDIKMNAVVITNIPNSKQVRRGRFLAYLTIIWNSLEAIIAIGAGIVAGSIALVGFGFDSVIEVSSGAIILWRLASGEQQGAMRVLTRC